MIIRLNHRFYDKESILEAIHDFKEVAKGNIIDEEFRVKLEQIRPEGEIEIQAEELAAEFQNYILGLMKHKHRA